MKDSRKDIHPELLNGEILWRCHGGKPAHVIDVEKMSLICGANLIPENTYYLKNPECMSSGRCKNCERVLAKGNVVIIDAETRMKNLISRIGSQKA